jgi:membrane-bound serine protease (ClpP class)
MASKRLGAALALFFLLTLPGSIQGATGPETPVLVLKIQASINPITARYVAAGINAAAREQAQAVLLELDTPGGLASSMDQIVQKMLAAPLPVVVYVYPPGARAASAGVFITMASQIAAMAPGTNIGAAHPVGSGGSTIPGVEGQKILNDAVAKIRSLAELRGHNAAWAAQAVRNSVSLPAVQAVRQGVVNLIADSPRALLQKIDGRGVAVAGGTVTLHTAGAPLKAYPMNFVDRFLSVLVDPNLAYILFLVGIFGLIIEFTTPGIGVPGILGGICFLLALLAFGIMPTNMTGVAIIVLGAVLFVVDVKAPTHGILTAGGIVALLLGSFLLFPPWRAPSLPGSRPLRISPALIVAMTAVMSGLFFSIVYAGIRALRRRVTTGTAGLIGASGVALTDLAPTGTVRVRWEEWSAFTPGEPIRRGEQVEVVAVQGLRLQVKRKSSSQEV